MLLHDDVHWRFGRMMITILFFFVYSSFLLQSIFLCPASLDNLLDLMLLMSSRRLLTFSSFDQFQIFR